MPCGRCRQLLWENGGPACLLMTPEGVLPMSAVLPQAFGPDNLRLPSGWRSRRFEARAPGARRPTAPPGWVGMVT